MVIKFFFTWFTAFPKSVSSGRLFIEIHQVFNRHIGVLLFELFESLPRRHRAMADYNRGGKKLCLHDHFKNCPKVHQRET
jgi:hypothetical protein